MNKIDIKVPDTNGLIFDMQHFCLDDGPGIRTLIFFMGCELNCPWCHNPECKEALGTIMYNSKLCINCKNCQNICVNKSINFDTGKFKLDKSTCNRCGECVEECMSGALRQIGRKIGVNQIIEEVLKDENYYNETGGGVTLSGGEPFMQAKFIMELLREIKKHKINTAVETSGYVDIEMLKEISKYVDLFLFDIKHASDAIHKKVIGKGNNKIWESLNYLKNNTSEIWIRIPIIPGFNDEVDIVLEIVKRIKEIKNLTRIELLPYHEFGKNKYKELGIEYRSDKIKPPNIVFMKKLGDICTENYDGKVIIKES